MHRYIRVILFSLICLVGTFFVLTSHVQAQTVPAPIMIAPNESTITGKVKPFITGLTISGTFVHVYIDGIYNGKTEILTDDSGTADFAYKPFLNLQVGKHNAWAIAENEAGEKSKPSNVLKFNIEQPMPAPTIFAPAVNAKTTYNRPFIIGLAKNDSLIKIFIDHKFNGQFQVANHPSGTANFAYQPEDLTNGNHLVYTTAIDSRGKESCWSNIIYFTVKPPVVAAKSVQEEDKETAVEVKGIEGVSEESEVVISPKVEEADKEEGKIIDEEIQQIIEGAVEEETAETGLIDEGKEKQGKLNLNLIIFIVFLVGIIAWIFWVNRELIKERREQAKKAAEDKTSKPAPPTMQDIEKGDQDSSPPPPQEQPPLV